MSATASDWAFWAGGANTNNAKFRVNHAGQLWATSATITGNITATSGKIGKYTIDDYLITGSGSTCTGMGGNQAFWAGSNDSSTAPFHVSYDGSLYASKANISGIINSTDGSIGGWKISSNGISVSREGTNSEGEDIYYTISLLSKDNTPIINAHAETYNDDSNDATYINDITINPYKGVECKNSDITSRGTVNRSISYTAYGIEFNDGSRLNSAKCRAGSVAHYWNSNTASCGTKNGSYTNLTSFSGGLDGTLSILHDKKSDYQIKINGNGVYSFQTRLHVNSPTGNKRVEVALFKNGDRYAAYASGYTTPVNYTMTYLNNYILYLSKGDTIDFRIAPIDGYSVNVQMGDILIYALDYDL